MPSVSPGAPFSEKYEILSVLGSGSNGTTYRARERASGRPLILKHIPVPASQAQVQALIFSGAAGNEEEVQHYYERSVRELAEELKLGEAWEGSSFYLPFRDYQIDPRETEIGYDIYLIADFCQTLPTFLSDHEITTLDALNLGLDLCDCIEALHERGVMFRNLKPENIYRTQRGTFLLGDLGLTRIDELPYASLPDAEFGCYSAPEYSDLLAPLNLTSELYSLGLVLYRIFNGNHAPFVDEETSIRAAEAQRCEGKPFPAPLYADYELSAIILRACAFHAEERYQTAAELRQDLMLYMKRNAVSSAPIAPPIVADPAEQIPADEPEEADDPIRFANVDELDDAFISHFSPIAAEGAVPAAAADDGFADPLTDAPAAAPASPAPKRRKGRAWIPIAVLLVLAGAFAAWWFLLRAETVEVRTLGSTDKGTSSITVYVDCTPGEAELELVCADAYGNSFTLPYTGSTCTFTGLSSGTSYTIELRAVGRARITGSSSILVTTATVTEIVSFSAGEVTGTSAELALVVNGPEPESWVISYEASNGDAGSLTCRSHNLSLQDLAPNTTYTFTLEPEDGYETVGQLSCTFTTTASAELIAFSATQLDMDAVTVEWSFEGETDVWNVTCEGSDGSTATRQVDGTTASFDGLTPGVEYTISLDCAGLQASPLSSISVTTPTGTVTSFEAVAESTTSVTLHWEYEGELPEQDWMILYTVGPASEPIRSVATSSEMTCTLTGLIPDAEYTFELATASGTKLQGESTAVAATPAPETYSAHGLDSVFIGLFLEPTNANWTYRDLIESRSEFRTDESVAFAVQAISGVRGSSETVDVLYVVRDADGLPVDYYSTTYQWNSMWSNDLHVGALARTPQTPGSYRLEIYVDGMILRGKNFEITG